MSYPPYGGGGYPPAAPGYPPPSGGMPVPQAAPAGLPYHPQPYGPGQAQPYGPPQPGYPGAGGGMPQPDLNQPAGGMLYTGGMPSQQPYPAAAPYPSAAAMPGPPTSYPPSGGQAPYPGSAPYPSGGAGAPYPSAQVPYPPQSTQQPPARPVSGPSPGSQRQQQPASASGKANQPSTDAYSSSYYTCAKAPGDTGIIKPLKDKYNPETDSTQLRNCLKSLTVNETVIVNLLPHRSNAQRQEIRRYYKTMFGKDLIEDCRAALSGDFESITIALLMTPAEYDAYLVYKAIEGAGTDEETLVEVLCTRTNAQISELARTYKELYKATVEQQLGGDTSGHFKRMLISLSNGARQEDQGVNPQKAEEDAKKLYKAGAARLGTDESTFNAIFVSQSFEQLRAVFGAYQRLYKKDMEKVIKSEMSGDLERGMKTIVRFTLDKHSYFANLLYKAMKGLGTDEKALIRTLVTRSEIDLEQIKCAFSNIKGESKPLSHWIKKETSGPFRDMLLHVIGEAR